MSNMRFRISSALKSIIGKDLITNDFVAIFELVKNAFDADAKNIKVSFFLNDVSRQRITIADDGVGMNENDLLNKWLFVAYSAKKEGHERSQRKAYAGNKGVGRFSCDRLGAVLRIQTKVAEEPFVHSVTVNWGRFEQDAQVEFKDVDVEYSTQPSFDIDSANNFSKSGVVLEVSQLREPESWDRQKLIRLRRSLSKLIPPFANLEDQGKIQFFCDREVAKDFQEIERAAKRNGYTPQLLNGIIKNDVLDILSDKTTSLEASISTDGYLHVSLVDRETMIYCTKEDVRDVMPFLIPSDFKCRLSFVNLSAKHIFGRRMGIPSTQYGSVFLIRNGFLVFPVGEENDDYWGLDRRKAQGYARYLGTRELIGYVSVRGDENSFKESSSRDKGLIDTPASRQLSDCVMLCIKKLEAYVVGVSWCDKLDKNYSTSERMSLDGNREKIIELVESLALSKTIQILNYNRDLVGILSSKADNAEEALERLENIAERQHDLQLHRDVALAKKKLRESREREARAQQIAEDEAKARKDAEQRANSEAQRAQLALTQKDFITKELEEEKKRTLFLVGLGSRDKDVLEGFLHQIVIYAANAKVQIEEMLVSSGKKRSVDISDMRVMLEQLKEINEKIITTSRFATHANFRMDSSFLNGDLAGFIVGYICNIAKIYASRIVVESQSDGKAFPKKFKPVELGIALENLIDNAKKARAAKISFHLSVKDSILNIDIVDRGLGINPAITDSARIFEKGFSRTNGSGLGLHFCKQVFESLGGTLFLSANQPKRGAHFVVRIGK